MSVKINFGKKIIVYTDGSCLKNPAGAGGFASCIICKEKIITVTGGSFSTTNNIMEMTAVWRALEYLYKSIDLSDNDKKKIEIDLYSDSQYLINGFNKHWVQGWKKKGWKTASGTSVKNINLWKAIDELVSKFSITFIWCKGHVGNKYNEECDTMAKNEAIAHQEINENRHSFINEEENDDDSILIDFLEPDENLSKLLEINTKDKSIKLSSKEEKSQTFDIGFVNKHCKKTIDYLNRTKHIDFKKMLSLKVGGKDYFSSLHKSVLVELMFNKKEDIKQIENENFDIKDEESALRWLARGLNVNLCIRKVKTDKEVQENLSSSKQKKKNQYYKE